MVTRRPRSQASLRGRVMSNTREPHENPFAPCLPSSTLKSWTALLSRHREYAPLMRRLSTIPVLRGGDIFELFFAVSFLKSHVLLEYEQNANPEESNSVDFSFHCSAGETVWFELVSPELSDAMKQAIVFEPGDSLTPPGATLELSSSHPMEHCRPQAYGIRLQEKILEKVCRLAPQSDVDFSIIVVDASQVHLGHINEDDCRQLMFGMAADVRNQQFWKGGRIRGLLERQPSRPGRENEDRVKFQERCSAVWVVPSVSERLMGKSYFVPNLTRSESHRRALAAVLKPLVPFEHCVVVAPARSKAPSRAS